MLIRLMPFCLLVVAAFNSSALAQPPQAQPFGVEYLFPAAEFVYVAQPAKLFSDPTMQAFPLEFYHALQHDALGFGPEEVEWFLMAGGPYEDVEVRIRYGFGMVFRTERPMNWAEVFPNGRRKHIALVESPEGAVKPQVRAVRSEDQPEVEDSSEDGEVAEAPIRQHAVAIDEQTLILATPSLLPLMLAQAEGEEEGLLAGVMRQQKSSAPFQAYANPTHVEFANQNLEIMMFPRRDLHFVTGLDELAEYGVLEFDPGDSGGLTIHLTAKDEQRAKQIRSSVIASLDRFEAICDPTELSPENVEADLLSQMRYVHRLSQNIRSALEPKRLGNQVTITTVGGPRTPSQWMLAGAVAMHWPSPTELRRKVERSQPHGKLREIGLAMHNYHDKFGRFPPRVHRDEDGNPLLSWRVHLLPFLGERELYEQFKLDEPWDSPLNQRLIARIPAAFAPRPSDQELAKEGKTRMLMPVGEGMPGGVENGIRFAEIFDGSSNTIMAVEAAPQTAVIWTQPEDLPIDSDNPARLLRSGVNKPFHAVMYDGSVLEFDGTFTSENLRRLMMHSDGLPVELPSKD